MLKKGYYMGKKGTHIYEKFNNNIFRVTYAEVIFVCLFFALFSHKQFLTEIEVDLLRTDKLPDTRRDGLLSLH